jgi:hypothetical protein
MNGQAISAAFHTVRHRNTCVQFLVYPKKPLMIHACGRSTGSFTRGPHCILFEPCGVNGNEESFTLDDNGALDPSGCRQDACPPLLISRASLQLWATELTSRVSLEGSLSAVVTRYVVEPCHAFDPEANNVTMQTCMHFYLLPRDPAPRYGDAVSVPTVGIGDRRSEATGIDSFNKKRPNTRMHRFAKDPGRRRGQAVRLSPLRRTVSTS